ncbi:phosphoglycerate mutase [Calothrix sp. NIES-4071]|nr:phosphoglycerate mutase [Calothrix sp. NIES-4071]BAZ57599.1 phosphoglycerate mutase [Calothrix sp. NIES-4105]
MATVWLIRHGESEANSGLPTDDQINIKLTEKGHQQARQIAVSFSQQPSLVVTSPFLRTKQTAQPTIERFASTPHIEWQVQEFNYLATARRKNTTLAERIPMAEEYWQRCDPNYIDGEGAESFAEMVSRVNNLKTLIQNLDEGFVAVFTHGMFMRAFLWSLLFNGIEASVEGMQQFRVLLDLFKIPNGAILKLFNHNQEIWVSSLQTSHLVDLTALSNID